ncbi:MAG: hypothetical protein LBH03_03390 [Holophagales bacterium]|jgi:hypothetical protein|nr:hypothetical protein [Holophagales bacterium]
MHRFAALLITIPLAAQAPFGKWSFGVHGATPDLTGHFSDSGSSPTNFDIKKDFKLKNDKMSLGVHMDYTGSRFGFYLGYVVQDFAGQNRIIKPNKIEIGGQILSDVDVKSSLKNTAFDVCGTIKILRGTYGAWLGVDVGIQAWYLDLNAEGSAIDTSVTDKLEPYSITVPIPQLGISCGFQGLQNRLGLRGKLHFLAYNGAKYIRYTADARYYVLPWLGVRAFMENQSFDAPKDSIIADVEAKLDSNLYGFGVAVRW